MTQPLTHESLVDAIDELLSMGEPKAPNGLWFCGVADGCLLLNRKRDTFCHVGYDALPVVIRERTFKRSTWQRMVMP